MTLFFMSSLNTVRHLYYFIQALVRSNNENNSKYILGNRQLLFLSISIGYILTVIFNGITL